MRFDTLDITAPALFEEAWNESEMLGAIVWLWMHSAAHREVPLHTLPTLLLPALKSRQFILASERGKPVFYLSWLNLSQEAEYRYLRTPPICLLETDWNCGERLWIHDWVAPFGHTATIARLLQQRLFANRCVRTLYHRGDQRGLKVKTFHGIGVMPETARAWFAAHPLPPAFDTDFDPLLGK